jgi:hypothetical protein
MSIERLLFALLLLVSAAAWTGALDRPFPERSRLGPDGVLVLPRHERSGERVSLPLEDGARATLTVPKSTRRPRPVVALLEAKPGDARCRELEITWERTAFVLCVPVDQELDGTARRLRAAMTATKQRFGDYVAKGSVVLVGALDAAEQATLIARQEPAFFRRLILVDGARLWTSSLAAVFKRGGGERVLFVCETEECRRSAPRLTTVTRSVGLEVAVESGDGWLARRAKWLVAGDSRFQPGR